MVFVVIKLYRKNGEKSVVYLLKKAFAGWLFLLLQSAIWFQTKGEISHYAEK